MKMNDVIPIESLTVGRVYRLQARNLIYGVWNGKDFLGIREKFGRRFLDGCEVPYATAFPLEDTGIDVPPQIPLKEYLGSYDERTGRETAFDIPVSQGGKGWYFVDTGEASTEIRSVARGNPALYEFMDKVERSRGAGDPDSLTH